MTEQTATFASNQTEAAAALGISEAEWQALRKQPGFPEKTDQGWDMAAIAAWVDSDTDPAAAQPPAGDDQGEQTSDVDPDEPTDQATAGEPSDDDPDGDLPDEEPVEIRTVTITLPLSVPRQGTYIAGSRGRINTRLRSEQLPAYRALHAGLRESNATYANGRPVDSAGDVLQWLFQQITEATAATAAE
jgi:hypothetical protein